MQRQLAFAMLLASFAWGRAYVVGGAAMPQRKCTRCALWSISTTLSSASVSSQLAFRYCALEIYVGATASGTSDTLWATAEKYKTYADTLQYLAEADSYSLDLKTYLIQPEVGVRLYLLPRSNATPYLNIGAFWVIPILSGSYSETFIHYDSTGAIIRYTQNTSEGEPEVSISGLYEIGFHLGVGAQYSPSEHFAVFGELGFRAILGGAKVKYDYLREIGAERFVNERHLWSGGAKAQAFSTAGYIGVRFYW